MAGKTTLRDVAKAAGVGTATAERVLNGRGSVRPETVERVIAAARRLDYPKRLPARHRGVLRIEVVLVRPETPFFSRLSKAFGRISETLDPSIAVHRTFLREDRADDIATHIAQPVLRRSALILAVPETPAIREALRQVRAEGIPVVQIVSQMAGLGIDYVGIDNEASGRMAGLLMAAMQRTPGTVIALCHSQVYAVHRERVRGFSDFMTRPAARHLDFRQAAFTRDEDDDAKDRLREALDSYPDLSGIYNVGGANVALCNGLERWAKDRNICVIGHELTEQSKDALARGTMAAVIDQAPETQARRSLDLVLYKLGLLETDVDRNPIRFITITAENI